MTALSSGQQARAAQGSDHTEKVKAEAASWLAEFGPGQRAIDEVRDRFGLSATQLAEVCSVAAKIRAQSSKK